MGHERENNNWIFSDILQSHIESPMCWDLENYSTEDVQHEAKLKENSESNPCLVTVKQKKGKNSCRKRVKVASVTIDVKRNGKSITDLGEKQCGAQENIVKDTGKSKPKQRHKKVVENENGTRFETSEDLDWLNDGLEGPEDEDIFKEYRNNKDVVPNSYTKVDGDNMRLEILTRSTINCRED